MVVDRTFALGSTCTDENMFENITKEKIQEKIQEKILKDFRTAPTSIIHASMSY